MNWIVIVPALLRLLDEAPALVADIRDLWSRITSIEEPPAMHGAVMSAAFGAVSPPPE